MKPHVREFLEQEAVGAARSREVKRAKKKARNAKFIAWLTEKAERIEMNGNPAHAEQFRNFWTDLQKRPWFRA